MSEDRLRIAALEAAVAGMVPGIRPPVESVLESAERYLEWLHTGDPKFEQPKGPKPPPDCSEMNTPLEATSPTLPSEVGEQFVAYVENRRNVPSTGLFLRQRATIFFGYETVSTSEQATHFPTKEAATKALISVRRERNRLGAPEAAQEKVFRRVVRAVADPWVEV